MSPKIDLEQLASIQQRFQELERRMSDPEIISNQTKYQEIVKTHAELQPVVNLYKEYIEVTEEKESVESLLADPEMKEMAEGELQGLKEREETLINDLTLSLLPKDENDNKNAIVEIRLGTGGDEAALFAEDLLSMYLRYAEQNKWTVEVLSQQGTPIGGVKEVTLLISGKSVFGKLKFESGTHRVQRVPSTETQGRIHTSAATVAILPEAKDVDIKIDDKDLRIDTFRASGAGGQHVNKTSSAIRITHLPTGVVAACQDERSQFQNKDKAMQMLRAKLYDMENEKQKKERADARSAQLGSGDRSEKIRTYNWPQSRVTDHRINLTLHSLDKILNGDLDPLIDALIQADQLEKMQALGMA